MLRGRTGLSPVMIGRTASLDRLLGLVEASEVATGEGPSIALIAGEPGIGKSRLVREFVADLPSDVAVLAIQAQPGSLGRPFDMVAALAPEGDAPGAVMPDAAIPDAVMPDAVIEVIRQAATAGRVVLVAEDLHWADADSAHLLEHIAAQPWPQLVIVGTFRPNDLSRKAPGGELVSRFERQYSVEQIRLDRLDRMEVGALLSVIASDAPTSGEIEAVYRRSGGNPFVLEELVRCCGPDTRPNALLSAQLPWSIDEAVHQQLTGLDPDQRRAVEALAVFGDPAPFDLLARVAELADDVLMPALRDLIHNDLLIGPAADEFWFSHALIADAVLQQLIGRERRRLHQRSLEALRELPEPDHAALVRHAVGAGEFDLVVPIAREGARRYLDRGASFQALRLAVEALGESPDDVELLAVATEAAWRLDFLTEGLTSARRWLSVSATDLDRVDAQRLIARILHEQGLQSESDEALAELITLARSLPPGRARGRSYGAVAQLFMISDKSAPAIEWADRASVEAAANGDSWLAAQALVEHGSALIDAGDHELAEAELRTAYRAALVEGDRVLACRALNNLLGLVIPHSPQGAELRAELGELSASAGFDKLGSAMLAIRQAEAAFGSGDLPTYRRAVAEVEQYGCEWMVEQNLVVLQQSELAIEEGHAAAALAMLADLDVRTQVDHHAGYARAVSRLRLLGAAQMGDPQLAEAAWGALIALPPPTDTSPTLPTVIDACDAALFAGIDPSRVRDDLCGSWLVDHPSFDLLCHHIDGLLLLAQGQSAAAATALAAVLTEPDARLSLPVVAVLRIAHAQALLANGDRAEALAAVRVAAHHDLAAWPGWRRDRAEALLRRLEGSSARADGDLTAREREVAALIAEGLTNGQLAERLFISPRTAAVHVSNILMKLGLSGRAEVAAWAVRHGVVLQPG